MGEFRINGFEQIKAFYSWVFNNQNKTVTPSHISLYVFLINQNNRANWVEWFKLPYDLGMHGACIGSKTTYYKCLKDLTDWKLIEHEKGVNSFKAPVIKIICLTDNGKVSVPLSEPLTGKLSGQLTGQLSEPLTGSLQVIYKDNYKPITGNYKPVTGIEFFEEDFKNDSTRTNLIFRELKISPKLINKHKDSFIAEQVITGEKYEDFDSVMKHFYFWLKKKSTESDNTPTRLSDSIPVN